MEVISGKVINYLVIIWGVFGGVYLQIEPYLPTFKETGIGWMDIVVKVFYFIAMGSGVLVWVYKKYLEAQRYRKETEEKYPSKKNQNQK